MSSIKTGIYGTGVAADNHAYAIAKNTKYSLIAVSDNHISLSKDFARRHHVDRYYGDLEYLLSDRDVDIVTVTSPFTDNSFLLPYIAETGRSVIMETPLAPNLDEAERIIKISEDEGIFLFPVSQMISDPLIKYIISLIKENKLGKIEEFKLSWSFSSPVKRWMSFWKGCDKFTERELLLYSASPAFDLVYALFGKENVIGAREREGGLEITFNRGVLLIKEDGEGFSLLIKGENGLIETKNGKLTLNQSKEKIIGFDNETMRTPYSSLSSFYDDVYFALESGVWSEEKYRGSIEGLKYSLDCRRYFI